MKTNRPHWKLRADFIATLGFQFMYDIPWLHNLAVFLILGTFDFSNGLEQNGHQAIC